MSCQVIKNKEKVKSFPIYMSGRNSPNYKFYSLHTISCEKIFVTDVLLEYMVTPASKESRKR